MTPSVSMAGWIRLAGNAAGTAASKSDKILSFITSSGGAWSNSVSPNCAEGVKRHGEDERDLVASPADCADEHAYRAEARNRGLIGKTVRLVVRGARGPGRRQFKRRAYVQTIGDIADSRRRPDLGPR